jgi:hypothetical protein
MARSDRPPAEMSADLALAVLLEPLAEDARVLWLGREPMAPAARLAASASSVRAFYPEGDPTGASGPSVSRVRFGVLRPDGPSFRRGSFDLVVAPDLVALGLDHGAGVARLDGCLRPDGVLVVGWPVGGEAADLDESHRRLRAVLTEGLSTPMRDPVELFGQSGLSAWATARLDPSPVSADDPVVFDGSAGGDGVPARLLAVVGRPEPALDGYLIVDTGALPRDEAPATGAGREEASDADWVVVTGPEAKVPPGSPAGLGPADAADDADRELRRLEAALVERGRVVAELHEEVRRRGAIVRDLVEELRRREERPGPPSSTGNGAPQVQRPIPAAASPAAGAVVVGGLALEASPAASGPRGDRAEAGIDRARLARAEEAADAALERALDAELALTEARFRIDELTAEVEDLRRRPDPRHRRPSAPDLEARSGREETGVSEPPASPWVVDDSEGAPTGRYPVLPIEDGVRGHPPEPAGVSVRDRDAREALLAGRARGLAARLAELEERLRFAEAQATLSALEVEEARGRTLGVERRAAELEDQLGLALSRGRAETAGQTGRLKELEGELAGLRHRLGDREASLVSLRNGTVHAAARDQLAEEVARLTHQLGEAQAREARATLELAGAEERAETAEARAEALEEELAECARQRRADGERRVEAERALAEAKGILAGLTGLGSDGGADG